MTKYEPRFYRNRMGEGRFRSFVAGYKDSDLWIGVDAASFKPEMPAFAQRKLIELRKELENYILSHPEFATSFSPVSVINPAPQIAKDMADAGKLAQMGPMAAVAGVFSEYLGKSIQQEFTVKEIVVENGGDIYLSLEKDLVMSVYAGKSPLSGKIGIEIPAKETPLGICTSAGTVGPSTSFGKADAVMIICKNTAIADAFATAIGNKVKTADDIQTQLQQYEDQKEILSNLIICDGKIGIKGCFDLKIIGNN